MNNNDNEDFPSKAQLSSHKSPNVLDLIHWKVIMCCCLNRVEKYRPNSLEDLISHKDIITTSKLFFPGPTYA